MILVRQSFTSATGSNWIPVDPNGTGNIPIGIIIDFDSGSGSGIIEVAGTCDDPTDTHIAIDLPNLDSVTSTTIVTTSFPWKFIQFICDSHVSGTINCTLIQGSLPG